MSEKNKYVRIERGNSFNKIPTYQNSGNNNFKEKNKFNKNQQTVQKTNKTHENVIACHNCKKVGHKNSPN